MKVTNNNININFYINSGNKYANSKTTLNKTHLNNNEFNNNNILIIIKKNKFNNNNNNNNINEFNNLSSINFNNNSNKNIFNNKSIEKKELARSNSLNYLFINYKINNYNDKMRSITIKKE